LPEACCSRDITISARQAILSALLLVDEITENTALDGCLPAALRGPGTTITKVGAGFSGAGVYRVDADGRAYVLKKATGARPVTEWRRTLFILRAAAEANLAPRVVHIDESRRAIVSEFIDDQNFPRSYHDPRTHASALTLLGETLRRVHLLPVPDDAAPSRPRELLAGMWAELWTSTSLPAFVMQLVEHTLAEAPPPAERQAVLSHNDANPSNLVFDGERLLLLDWDAAAPNDPFYDLAVVSLFLRMDEKTSGLLIGVHDGAPPPSSLPPTFLYYRRLTGVMLGVGFLSLARQSGHVGTAPDAFDAAPPLADFYQKLRSGVLSLGTGEGRWAFGLGLMREAFALER
jgi:aminoglycoside phosphotransferase (APT) family kinase protein